MRGLEADLTNLFDRSRVEEQKSTVGPEYALPAGAVLGHLTDTKVNLGKLDIELNGEDSFWVAASRQEQRRERDSAS